MTTQNMFKNVKQNDITNTNEKLLASIDYAHYAAHNEQENQLDLEVDIDESLRHILDGSPERDTEGSELIDVTLIRESPSRSEITVSLGQHEVKSFVEMMTRNAAQPNEVNPNSTSHTSPQQPGLQYQQVYTAPDMFDKMRRSLKCERKYSDMQKPGSQCLCQHCGMIGVLIESQKRPAIPHQSPFEDIPSTSQQKGNKPEHQQPRHSKHRRTDEDDLLQAEQQHRDELFEEMLNKLKALEQRVEHQEEQAVGKDYFKYVIRKILTQYIDRIVRGQVPDNVCSSSTQYSRSYLDSSMSECKKCRTNDRNIPQRYGRNNDNSKRGVDKHVNISQRSHEVRINHDNTQNETHMANDKDYSDLRQRIMKVLKEEVYSDGPSRYGKSRLTKPLLNLRRDLPNDIRVECFQNTMCLPQVITSHFQCCKEDSSNDAVNSNAFKDLLDNMSCQIYDDIVRNQSERNSNICQNTQLDEKPVQYIKNVKNAMDDSNFKRNIEITKRAQNFDQQKRRSTSTNRLAEDRRLDIIKESSKTSSLRSAPTKIPVKKQKDFDVKYLNPSSEDWTESSSTDVFQDCSQIPQAQLINEKDSLTYKMQYLRYLARGKRINENELWHNIWDEAKHQFTSKQDVLTICIPSRKPNKRPIELELTWSDLQEIAKATNYQLKTSDILKPCSKM